MQKTVQIVQDTTGRHWVGCALYPGEQYISFDKVRRYFPAEQVELEPTANTLCEDIQTHLGVTVAPQSPAFADVAKLLACTTYFPENPLYCINHRAAHGVSRVGV